jgi:NAD(P)-dependent dehydrogenase (short-subunit alcohol dehydrogenase family)
VLELERLRSVPECAERLRSSGKKIDILILNAGVALVPYNLTEDGFETHSGYFADCKPKEPNKLVYDSTVRARLWHLSEKLVGLTAEKSL